MKAIFDGPTALRFETGHPANLRLTLTFAGVAMSATGVDDVAELTGGFQLDGEATVDCDCAGFLLVPNGHVVRYRDADTEVAIPRAAYDRLAFLVTALIQISASMPLSRRPSCISREARAAAWRPSHIED